MKSLDIKRAASQADTLNSNNESISESVAVMGSTGSIGCNTLKVLKLHPNKYRVFALTANKNAKLLFAQICEFKPRYAVLLDETQMVWLSEQCRAQNIATELLSSTNDLELLASHAEVDTVMAAIVGSAGLKSTLAAVSSGKKVLLANKEALVMAGELLISLAQASSATLLPIDSEHNAIFQCLANASNNADQSTLNNDLAQFDLAALGVRKLLLTGSGGPFRQLPLSDFVDVTPDQACAHPNWAMGRKISVDSATMMNKGLELIEACWLFNCNEQDIDILIHPQSVIHSMVEYVDGSVLAQLGQPDMRTPIAHALAWPHRIESAVQPLAWTKMRELTFEAPDYQRFPALQLARQVAKQRGSASVVMNAANEVAVDAFLQQQIPFTAIVQIVESCLDQLQHQTADSLDSILASDAEARACASQLCTKLKS